MSFEDTALFYEAVVSNNSFVFTRKSIMYTMALLWGTRSGTVLREGRAIRQSTADPENHPKQATCLIVWPGDSLHFLKGTRSPHTDLETKPSYSTFSSSSRPCPSLPQSNSSCIRCKEGNRHCPRIFPHCRASKQRGPGLPSSQRVRCSG